MRRRARNRIALSAEEAEADVDHQEQHEDCDGDDDDVGEIVEGVNFVSDRRDGLHHAHLPGEGVTRALLLGQRRSGGRAHQG